MTVFHRFTPASIALGAAMLAGSTLLLPPAAAQSTKPAAAAPTVRLRGTVVFVDAQRLMLKERDGQVINLARADKMPISEVYPIKLADIKKGSYIGTAAMPQTDGRQKALEVLVFPESARGAGEGHRPWDLEPESTMTNATVAELASAPSRAKVGQEMRLSYKGGEQIVVVPAGVPVVSFKPGDESLLIQGAKVLVTAQEVNGQPTALRVSAGRKGFTPPM